MNVKLPKIDQSQKKLPSEYQIGDYCHVVVSRAASESDLESILYYGKVIKIHFAPNKLTYDLEFGVSIDETEKKRYVTRIHNIDSGLCVPIEARAEMIRKESEFVNTEHDLFRHGGWDDSTKHPGRNYNEWKDDGRPEYSVDVLIDLDGNRKVFRVGYYDFNSKKWIVYDQNQAEYLEVDHMKWTSIPLVD